MMTTTIAASRDNPIYPPYPLYKVLTVNFLSVDAHDAHVVPYVEAMGSPMTVVTPCFFFTTIPAARAWAYAIMERKEIHEVLVFDVDAYSLVESPRRLPMRYIDYDAFWKQFYSGQKTDGFDTFAVPIGTVCSFRFRLRRLLTTLTQ